MKNFFDKKPWLGHLLGLLILTAMIFVAMLIKERDIAKASGAQNLEATYHALLTIESLRQNAIRDHWLLPTVTLGQENDAFVSWGGTVPTESGDFIYTSFTSPGFLLPYITFELIDLKATVKNLARFNMAIGAFFAVALYFFINRLLLLTGASLYIVTMAALVGVSVALFSREALLSTGVIYWPHAFYQVLLVCSLWLLFNILRFGTSHIAVILYSKVLLLLLFLGAWTEWTGYVFNLGLVLILWFQSDKPELRGLALKILTVTAAAGAFTLLHYGLVVGFSESINAFAGRFFARSTQRGSITDLIGGYGLSYGIFLLITLVVVVRGYIFGAGIAGKNQYSAIVAIVLLASTVPLIENLIMLQHATEFSFDRLKFIIPSAIAIALALNDRSFWFRSFVIAATAFACLHGVKSHRSDMARYSDWSHHHQENIGLVERLREHVDFGCATFASNLGVRGYANLLIGRSIYEYKTLDQAHTLNRERGGCASVFLEGSWVFPDLQRYSQSIVIWPDGRKSVLKAGEIK